VPKETCPKECCFWDDRVLPGIVDVYKSVLHNFTNFFLTRASLIALTTEYRSLLIKRFFCINRDSRSRQLSTLSWMWHGGHE